MFNGFKEKVSNIREKVSGTPKEQLDKLNDYIKMREAEIATMSSPSMRDAETWGLQSDINKRDKLIAQLGLEETQPNQVELREPLEGSSERAMSALKTSIEDEEAKLADMDTELRYATDPSSMQIKIQKQREKINELKRGLPSTLK